MPPYAMVMAIGAATTQVSLEDAKTGALGWPASASVAHLKVKGTVMVASFAISSSTIAQQHPHFQVGAVGRPDIGPQRHQGAKERALLRGDLRLRQVAGMGVRGCHGSESGACSFAGYRADIGLPGPIVTAGTSLE